VEFRVAEIVRRYAREQGGAPMLTCGDRTLTYAEVDERSNRAAQALAGEGIGPQDRVAFLDKNGTEFWELQFGAAKLGAVIVSVNWRLAPREIAWIIDDARAPVLVVGPDFYAAVEEIEGQLTSVKKIVAVGEHPRWPSYESWLAGADPADPATETAGSDIALQLYTSGTTGLPKGAMISHDNLAALLSDDGPNWGMDATSTSLLVMPLFHIAGAGWGLVGMARGARTVIAREFDPAKVLAGLEDEHVTHTFFVPVMLQVLSSLPGAQDREYRDLRHIFYGASPITEAVLTRALQTFRHTEFHQVYGLTETTGAITQLDHEDHDPGGSRAHLLRSAGRPYPHVELRIIDPQTGAEAPRGTVGELWTRSPQNVAGYWAKPEESARAFREGGWFATGDAGYLDEDGYLFLTDRIKDMIVSGGENVYPIEVENVLGGHPEVAEVAVIGVPDDKWGEAVKAVVVRRPGGQVGEGDLIAYARGRLAGFKCPKSVDFAEELPRNPSGKLLKKDLRAPYWEGRDRQIG
jgi:long-chain acyl-CoA synthetase